MSDFNELENLVEKGKEVLNPNTISIENVVAMLFVCIYEKRNPFENLVNEKYELNARQKLACELFVKVYIAYLINVYLLNEIGLKSAESIKLSFIKFFSERDNQLKIIFGECFNLFNQNLLKGLETLDSCAERIFLDIFKEEFDSEPTKIIRTLLLESQNKAFVFIHDILKQFKIEHA
jgi:hypothetical protein